MPAPQVNRHADGSISITQADGSEFNMDPQGRVLAKRCNVQTVGVRHIAEVETFYATRIVNSCSYVLHFANGGVLQYAYSHSGELLHLQFDHLACELGANGQAMFFIPPTPQASGSPSAPH